MNLKNQSNQQPEEYIGRYYFVSKSADSTYCYSLTNDSEKDSLFNAVLHAINPVLQEPDMSDEQKQAHARSFVSKLSAIGYLLTHKDKEASQPIILGVPHPSNKKQGAIGLSLFYHAVFEMCKEDRSYIPGKINLQKWFKTINFTDKHLAFIDDIRHNIRMKTFFNAIYCEEITKHCPKIYATSSGLSFIKKAKEDNRFHLIYFGENWRKQASNDSRSVEDDPFLPMIAEDCIGIYEKFGLIKED